MGSKKKFAKELLSIILKNKSPDQIYLEPFVGGANMIEDAPNPRIGNDLNSYLIALYQALEEGWFPNKISKEQYQEIKKNKDQYPKYLVGWTGIGCSYSGKWFGGYAGITQTKQGPRDYQEEALKALKLQIPKLKKIQWFSLSYQDLIVPQNAIVYADPPYQNTTRYQSDFDHQTFWNWCRKISKTNPLFISEYQAPNDFQFIWEKETSSSLSANGSHGGNKISTEKLFIHRSQLP